MPEQEGTTTVEVKYDTWAALDRRKGRGDSFDDVIKNLINASAVGFGDLDVGDQGLEWGEIEELSESERQNVDGDCAQGDPITGDICGDADVTHRQKYRYKSDGEWDEFYYCEEHAPDPE